MFGFTMSNLVAGLSGAMLCKGHGCPVSTLLADVILALEVKALWLCIYHAMMRALASSMDVEASKSSYRMKARHLEHGALHEE